MKECPRCKNKEGIEEVAGTQSNPWGPSYRCPVCNFLYWDAERAIECGKKGCVNSELPEM